MTIDNKPLMNRMVLNHLIFEAYETTAYAFATQLNIDLSDSETIHSLDPELILGLSSIKLRRRIKDLIYEGEIEKVIELLSWERPELLERDETLYFRLLVLNLIEIIKRNYQNRTTDTKESDVDQDEFILKVIEFIKTKVLKKVIKKHQFMKQLELVMTLLLYCGNTSNEAQIPDKLKNLFRFQVKRDVFDLINKKIIIADSFKGEQNPLNMNFEENEDFNDGTDIVTEDEEQEDESGTKESSYKDSKYQSNDENDESQDHQSLLLLTTDSTMNKMVKLWIWLRNNLNDKSGDDLHSSYHEAAAMQSNNHET